MALLRTRTEKPAPEVVVENEVDVLSLRRLHEHPRLAPLVARRAEMRRHLQEREDHRAALQRELAAVEHTAASAMVEDGAAYSLQAVRQAKLAIADCEDEARIIGEGLRHLDEVLETTTSEVREEVEATFNARRLPHVRALIAGLAALIEENEQIRAIERRSSALLQVACWELYGKGLQAWLWILKRKLRLLDPDAAEVR